jgi:hypothetical protein
MFEGAVMSEPFSAINRGKIREPVRSRLAHLPVNLPLTRIYSQLNASEFWTEQGTPCLQTENPVQK